MLLSHPFCCYLTLFYFFAMFKRRDSSISASNTTYLSTNLWLLSLQHESEMCFEKSELDAVPQALKRCMHNAAWCETWSSRLLNYPYFTESVVTCSSVPSSPCSWHNGIIRWGFIDGEVDNPCTILTLVHQDRRTNLKIRRGDGKKLYISSEVLHVLLPL